MTDLLATNDELSKLKKIVKAIMLPKGTIVINPKHMTKAVIGDHGLIVPESVQPLSKSAADADDVTERLDKHLLDGAAKQLGSPATTVQKTKPSNRGTFENLAELTVRQGRGEGVELS